MNYIELINAFWEKNKVAPLSSHEISFYFYLLNECASQGWVNPFRLPTRKICFELDFRKDTITNVRNSLKQKGFINFKKGDRRSSDPEYEILDWYDIAYQKTYQKTYQKSYQKSCQNDEDEEIHITNSNMPIQNSEESNEIDEKPVERKEAKERSIVLTDGSEKNKFSQIKCAREGSEKKTRIIVPTARARDEVFIPKYESLYGEKPYIGAKEMTHLRQLLLKIRFQREEKGMSVDDDGLLKAFNVFLDKINKEWVFDNFSPQVINGQFNNIISQIRNKEMEETKGVQRQPLNIQTKSTGRGFCLPLSKDDMRHLLGVEYLRDVKRRGMVFVNSEMLRRQADNVARLMTEEKMKFGLYICGRVGNGKSTILRAIKSVVNGLVAKGEFSKGEIFDWDYMSIVDARDMVRYFMDNYHGEFALMKERRFLAIDDVGKDQAKVLQYGTEFCPFIELLDYRYEKMLPTIITSNLTAPELVNKYGDLRLADRMNEMFDIVSFEDKSFRV